MTPELFRRLYLESPIIAFAALTVLSIVCSFLMKHYIRARQFNRTDAIGVQRFPSYWRMQLILFFERAAMFVAQVVFGFGLFFLLLTASRLIN